MRNPSTPFSFRLQLILVQRHLQFQELEDFCLCTLLPFSLIQLFQFSNSQIQLDQSNSARNSKKNGVIMLNKRQIFHTLNILSKTYQLREDHSIVFITMGTTFNHLWKTLISQTPRHDNGIQA